MKRLLLLLLMLCALVLKPASSQAQVGTMKWRFKSRAEVRTALTKTRGNLRKTYEVLVCAGRQGYCNTSIAYYEKIVVPKPFDSTAVENASYAFAYDIGYSYRPWSWKIDPDKSMIKLSSPTKAATARQRGEAVTTAEALVMRCMYNSTSSARKKAYQQGLQAVENAPKWADAHYWLAGAATNYAFTFQKDVWPTVKRKESWDRMVDLGQVAMRSYRRAENLDSGLRPYLFLEKAGAAELMADPQSLATIPSLIQAHLQAFPNYISWYQKTWGEDTQGFYRQWDQRSKAAADTREKVAALSG